MLRCKDKKARGENSRDHCFLFLGEVEEPNALYASDQTDLATSVHSWSLAMTCKARESLVRIRAVRFRRVAVSRSPPRLIANQPRENRSHKPKSSPTHIVKVDRVALRVTREPALRRDGQLLERLLARDAVALGDEVGGLVDPLHELLLLLQLGELGRDETENDNLVLRQVGERLVAPEGKGKVQGQSHGSHTQLLRPYQMYARTSKPPARAVSYSR
jgi:hypothetical protein